MRLNGETTGKWKWVAIPDKDGTEHAALLDLAEHDQFSVRLRFQRQPKWLLYGQRRRKVTVMYRRYGCKALSFTRILECIRDGKLYPRLGEASQLQMTLEAFAKLGGKP